MKNVELTINVEFFSNENEELLDLSRQLEELIENFIYDSIADADEVWATCNIYVDEEEEEEEGEEEE